MNHSCKTLCFLTSLCTVFALCPLSVFSEIQSVPDSSSIRADIEEAWLYPPLSVVKEKKAEIRASETGRLFQVRIEENESAGRFAVVVAPGYDMRVETYDRDGMTVKTTDVYPADIPGSWVLTKTAADNKPVSITYFFMEDPEVCVQFRPAGDKTLGDFIIYGAFAARGVPIGLPFERLYTASLPDVMSWTANSLPWNYADLYLPLYRSALQMIGVLRENLPRVVYAEDAVQTGSGETVHLSSGEPFDTSSVIPSDMEAEDPVVLSSGGFVKWIVDGLLLPLSGGAVRIAPLLNPTMQVSPVSHSGVLSEKYNLSFALDWTRNLAAAAASVSSGRDMMYEDMGVDVTVSPFASERSPSGALLSAGYIKDTGYDAKRLKPLLYALAASEPGKFYLGAIRQTDRSVTPEISFFNKCAAFFPYFDSTGRFGVSVFMDGAEITLETFMKTYSDTFVHLVRIDSSDMFFLN